MATFFCLLFVFYKSCIVKALNLVPLLSVFHSHRQPVTCMYWSILMVRIEFTVSIFLVERLTLLCINWGLPYFPQSPVQGRVSATNERRPFGFLLHPSRCAIHNHVVRFDTEHFVQFLLTPWCSPSCEADSRPFPAFHGTRPSPVPMLNQLNPLHTILYYLSKIRF